MELSICLVTQQERIGSTSVSMSFMVTRLHPVEAPLTSILRQSKPQSSTVTSTDENGLNAHGTTMTEQEQSLLHHQVVSLASMVLFLQHVEDMTWMVARCIERKIGNKG
jgi:hypothetical protein